VKVDSGACVLPGVAGWEGRVAGAHKTALGQMAGGEHSAQALGIRGNVLMSAGFSG